MAHELRQVTDDDWAALRAVRLRALADAPDAFGVTLAEATAHPDPFWQQRANGADPILLAWEDGSPVAMGGAFAPPEQALVFVWGMWTAPEARGRGYAGAILERLIAWSGARPLHLHVTEGNAGARALYVAHGFVPTSVWEPLREGSPLRIEELRRVP